MIVIPFAGLRNTLRVVLPFLLMPAIILLTAFGWRSEHYALVSFVMVVLALLLFLSGFEKKELGTRRLVLVSVLTALSVAGRMLPLIKPITALTILAAMYLGREAGFLVGAMSAVLSNFIMGQGPWTPFQMFAWGIIGFLAGLLAKPMQRSRLLLYCYGAVSGLTYSLLLDVWTVVWNYGEFTLREYWAAALTALPYTVLYAVSNLLFLVIFAKPVGDKLHRIDVKYGL